MWAVPRNLWLRNPKPPVNPPEANIPPDRCLWCGPRQSWAPARQCLAGEVTMRQLTIAERLSAAMLVLCGALLAVPLLPAALAPLIGAINPDYG